MTFFPYETISVPVQVNKRAAESLSDPTEYPNLFPNLDAALSAERLFASEPLPSASAYAAQHETLPDLIERAAGLSDAERAQLEAAAGLTESTTATDSVPEPEASDEEEDQFYDAHPSGADGAHALRGW
jgi:hypothetical protein